MTVSTFSPRQLPHPTLRSHLSSHSTVYQTTGEALRDVALWSGINKSMLRVVGYRSPDMPITSYEVKCKRSANATDDSECSFKVKMNAGGGQTGLALRVLDINTEGHCNCLVYDELLRQAIVDSVARAPTFLSAESGMLTNPAVQQKVDLSSACCHPSLPVHHPLPLASTACVRRDAVRVANLPPKTIASIFAEISEVGKTTLSAFGIIAPIEENVPERVWTDFVDSRSHWFNEADKNLLMQISKFLANSQKVSDRSPITSAFNLRGLDLSHLAPTLFAKGIYDLASIRRLHVDQWSDFLATMCPDISSWDQCLLHELHKM